MSGINSHGELSPCDKKINSQKIIFIEGNVASGKSSALEHLKQTFENKILLLEEPVTDWQKVQSGKSDSLNLLEHFYQDFSKYGYCFQTFAFLTRMKRLLEALERARKEEKEMIICERSIFTDREIFLESLYENGSITPMERAVYHNQWDFWIDLMKPFFQNIEIEFLFLSCPPEKALEHLHIRSRNEETGVGIDYLSSLEKRHRLVYQENTDKLSGLIAVLLGEPPNDITITTIENSGTREEYLDKLTKWLSSKII